MADYHLGEIESIFADIIWANAPLTSRLLAELAEQRLRWKPVSEAAGPAAPQQSRCCPSGSY